MQALLTLDANQFRGGQQSLHRRAVQAGAGLAVVIEALVEYTIRLLARGTVILDADLDSIKDSELLRVHKGLSRTTGRIVLLGHTGRVEFRNIRIKELPWIRVHTQADGGGWFLEPGSF